MPYLTNINTNTGEQWENERFQRNSITRGFKYIKNLNNSDLIIISDVDEIPDPNTLQAIHNNHIQVSYNILMMDMYYYNLNTKFNYNWYHVKIISYEMFKRLNRTCDSIRMGQAFSTIGNGGWHLSYFGDANFIKNKIENFSHQEYNNSNYTDISIIEERINNNKDLYGRDNLPIERVPLKSNNYLPVHYEKYLSRFYS